MLGNTIFIAGYARLPQGMAAKTLFESMTITAEVETKYGVILAVDCTLVTELGRNYIRSLLRGHSLNDGVDALITKVTYHYKGKAASALIAALKDLDSQYLIAKKQIKPNLSCM